MGFFSVGVRLEPGVAKAICHPNPMTASGIEQWVQRLVEQHSPEPLEETASVPSEEAVPPPSASIGSAEEDAADGEPGGLSDA